MPGLGRSLNVPEPETPLAREALGPVGQLVQRVRNVSGGGAQRSLLLFGDDSETVTRWVVVERPVRHLGLIR